MLTTFACDFAGELSLSELLDPANLSESQLAAPARNTWRAVDHEGEVAESFASKTRDKAAALKFITRAMKRHGRPAAITTDRLRSCKAALKEIGEAEKQEVGRWANNRVENSHLPFRRRERAMNRFRRMTTLRKFSSVHASVHNLFNQERHINDRETFNAYRSAALAEWKSLMA